MLGVPFIFMWIFAWFVLTSGCLFACWMLFDRRASGAHPLLADRRPPALSGEPYAFLSFAEVRMSTVVFAALIALSLYLAIRSAAAAARSSSSRRASSARRSCSS